MFAMKFLIIGTSKFFHTCFNSCTIWFFNADGMANSVDPDQTAPFGAV